MRGLALVLALAAAPAGALRSPPRGGARAAPASPRGGAEARRDWRPAVGRRAWWRRRRRLRRWILFVTFVNVVPCVARNDYAASPWPLCPPLDRKAPLVYRSLFYFARLRPRILFTMGACLRALQLTTPVQHVFDPGAGVGAGLNLLALFVGSRWPAPLVLGWAATRRPWRLLGAETPDAARVPITVKLQD